VVLFSKNTIWHKSAATPVMVPSTGSHWAIITNAPSFSLLTPSVLFKRGVCFPLQTPRTDTLLAQFSLHGILHSGFAGPCNPLELPCLFSLITSVGALPHPPGNIPGQAIVMGVKVLTRQEEWPGKSGVLLVCCSLMTRTGLCRWCSRCRFCPLL